MAFQQALGVRGRDPSSLLGDADGNDFVLLLINRVQDGGRRQQRNLVFATAPAKQHTYPELLHKCILNPCLNSPTAKLTRRTCDSNGRAPGPPRRRLHGGPWHHEKPTFSAAVCEGARLQARHRRRDRRQNSVNRQWSAKLLARCLLLDQLVKLCITVGLALLVPLLLHAFRRLAHAEQNLLRWGGAPRLRRRLRRVL